MLCGPCAWSARLGNREALRASSTGATTAWSRPAWHGTELANAFDECEARVIGFEARVREDVPCGVEEVLDRDRVVGGPRREMHDGRMASMRLDLEAFRLREWVIERMRHGGLLVAGNDLDRAYGTATSRPEDLSKKWTTYGLACYDGYAML